VDLVVSFTAKSEAKAGSPKPTPAAKGGSAKKPTPAAKGKSGSAGKRGSK
jgi:hypothetical protein